MVKQLTVAEFDYFYSDIHECQEVIRKKRVQNLLTAIKETPSGIGECVICQSGKENTVLKCSVIR